mmetsp:Transcript_20002/g.58432  ORF Transcript_20002/g.58432 Transcript_20002/m.58432 type:complete len:280 (-) Transcript_20002:2900-3739(-)
MSGPPPPPSPPPTRTTHNTNGPEEGVAQGAVSAHHGYRRTSVTLCSWPGIRHPSPPQQRPVVRGGVLQRFSPSGVMHPGDCHGSLGQGMVRVPRESSSISVRRLYLVAQGRPRVGTRSRPNVLCRTPAPPSYPSAVSGSILPPPPGVKPRDTCRGPTSGAHAGLPRRLDLIHGCSSLARIVVVRGGATRWIRIRISIDGGHSDPRRRRHRRTTLPGPGPTLRVHRPWCGGQRWTSPLGPLVLGSCPSSCSKRRMCHGAHGSPTPAQDHPRHHGVAVTSR